MAAAKGTRLHEFAKEAILLGIKQARSEKTLNMYINDAIGFNMEPEVVLSYSENAFGTADAISYREKKNARPMLRIHDLKTGISPTSVKQLEIYHAFFCLEYDLKPAHMDAELRIYQNDEILIHEPEVDDITHIMDKIKTFDKRIQILREDALR
jgi:hypothetical protein